MESTATQPKDPSAEKPSRIPPAIKAKIIDAVMELRKILTDPDEARARAAASELVDKIEQIED